MDLRDMMSGESLSHNDFVSAQMEQLIKALADPPPHPLERISQTQDMLSYILELKQKKNPVLENVDYLRELTNVMRNILFIADSLTVTADKMLKRQVFNTRDFQSWTKININRALEDIKKLGKSLNSLTPSLVTGGPIEKSDFYSYITLGYLHPRTLVSISQLESLLTSVLRRVDFRQYLDNTSRAGIIADCPDDHCAICLVQKLTVDMEFTVLDSCRHIFCTMCIKTWLEKENCCPMCRRRVDWIEEYSKSTKIFSLKDMMLAAIPLLIISLNQFLWQSSSSAVSYVIEILIGG